MSDVIRYSSMTLACPDPAALAAFYADISGGEVTFVHDREWAAMRGEGARLEFMGVTDYVPPRWPGDPRWSTSTSSWTTSRRLRHGWCVLGAAVSNTSRTPHIASSSLIRLATLSTSP
jgi:hypothetical protein